MNDCCEICKDIRNGVCPPMKMFCPKKLAEHDKQIRSDAIDEFVNFIFAGNVMHNQRFTTREEELFWDMAEQFKHSK